MKKKELKKVAVLGAGNLGAAIARGIATSGISKKEKIFLTRRNLNKKHALQSLGFVFAPSNQQAVEGADLIFLCVQPKQVEEVLTEIKNVLTDQQTIVSVVAGVSILQIQQILQNEAAIFRAMPNTAIAIQDSMTCIAGVNASMEKTLIVESIFSTLGEVLIIEERLMQAATVLGASGIAFFMRYLRAATQGGIQMGFHPEEAQKIAVQTAKGAANLILTNKSHPEMEIDRVTTPQGCTIEGLNEMEHQGFSSSLIRGLMTSYQKINTISK